MAAHKLLWPTEPLHSGTRAKTKLHGSFSPTHVPPQSKAAL